MEHLYIDESGSMTIACCEVHPYFIISVVRVHNIEKLKRAHKRFVSRYLADLKVANEKQKGSMFKDGKFVELKGAFLTPSLKKQFVEYFCKNNYFEVFYIIADNSKAHPSLYSNTARGFNYLLKLAIDYWHKQGFIKDSGIHIQIDERNEKTGSKFFLQDYLNTELVTSGSMEQDAIVQYFDSSMNKGIQVADVFANLMYSELRTHNYSAQIKYMQDNGYLPHIFRFPLR